MENNRDNIVPVRFTDSGLKKLDSERKQTNRSEYIRRAVAFAINHGFKVEDGGL